MTETGKKMSKLEQQLEAVRQKGVQETSMRLNEEQAEFVEKELKLPLIPCLYEVQTKRIADVSGTMGILKEIHRAYKRGQKTVRRDLSKKEVGVLERAGLKIRPVKYRIIFECN